MAANLYAVSPFLTNQSLATTFTSGSFSVGSFDRIGLQCVVTSAASLNGSLQLQISVDGASWVNLGTATALTVDTVFVTELQNPYYNFVRYVYTATAGSGTLNVRVGSVNLAR